MNYEILKHQGTWNVTSPKQEQIVALASTAKKFKDDNLKLSQQVKSGGQYSRKQERYTNKGKDKGKAKEVTSTKRKVRSEDAWKQVAPKTGEAQTNKVN
eukprot:13615994-Ditylum_brightwellii.AAC.1